MSNKPFYAIALLGALGAAAWIGPTLIHAKAAPQFTLYPGGGAPAVSLSDYPGKVVVLDFWASWCPPCRAAIPALERIHLAYEGRPVKVIGINVSDQVDPVQFMRNQMHATYTVLANGDEVGEAYGVKGIPTLVIIGKDGSIKFQESGWAPQFEQKMMDVIDTELSL